MIKKFICGFCRKKGKEFISTRKGLRKHLVDKHIRAKELTAVFKNGVYIHPDWWIVEEFK